MATNYAVRCARYVGELYESRGPVRTTRSRTAWAPISYTSMRAWMIMNYVLLACLLSLPLLAGYVVWTIIL